MKTYFSRFASLCVGLCSSLLASLGFLLVLFQPQAAQAQETEPQDDSVVTEQLWCQFEGSEGPGVGKHVVLVAGDDEYRSEEVMPMLAMILAKRHGFKCSVLFPINPQTNTIQPDFQTNIPGMHLLESADTVILGLRFRNLPDGQMKYFVDYVESGKPILGIRTTTHAFRIPKEREYHRYSYNCRSWAGGFGQQIIGDTWVNHHGDHKLQSCRGVIESANAKHPILRGVTDVWGPTDVYGIKRLPESASILMRGQVLKGMRPDDGAVDGRKNDPMMPIAWIKDYQSDSGKVTKVFNTTMGSSTDFESAHLRRMLVNATYWSLEMESQIPAFSDVRLVQPFHPTPYGFGNYRKGIKPSEYVMPNSKQ